MPDRSHINRLACLCALSSAFVVSIAHAQPSATAESTVVLPAGAAATARAGSQTVFGSDAFDVADQPGLAFDLDRFESSASIQRDRFSVRGVHPLALSVALPLHRVDRRLPAIAVVHRRLRDDGRVTIVDGQVVVELEHDLTTIAAGWSLASDRFRWGVALNSTTKSGINSLYGTVGDVQVNAVPGGFDDLLLSATLGAVVVSDPIDVHGGSVRLRWGVVARRIGEDVEIGSIPRELEIEPGTVIVEDQPRRSAMAPELSTGVGLALNAARLVARGAVSLSWPLYEEAPDRPNLEAGLDLEFHDLLTIRAGLRDDFRGTDLLLGAGLDLPLFRAWALQFDVAREPARVDFDSGEDAWVFSFGLRAKLPVSESDSSDDSLEALLDDIDAWIEESPQLDAGDGEEQERN